MFRRVACTSSASATSTTALRGAARPATGRALYEFNTCMHLTTPNTTQFENVRIQNKYRRQPHVHKQHDIAALEALEVSEKRRTTGHLLRGPRNHVLPQL
jgi:hypothetical protein